MYICNKCGRETFNPDMICDNCKAKKEIQEKKIEYEKPQPKKIETKVKEGPKIETVIEVEKELTEMNTNLMYCPECGKKISRNALQCPNCGRPFESNIRRKEKIVLKSGGIKAVAYITTLLGYALSGIIFLIGFIIPLAWFLYFCLYVSDKDKEKYDVTYFVKLRNEYIILMILGLPLAIFL